MRALPSGSRSANIGGASLYFALNYPQARVLAFEPAPQSYELLVRNTQGLKRLEAFNSDWPTRIGGAGRCRGFGRPSRPATL